MLRYLVRRADDISAPPELPGVTQTATHRVQFADEIPAPVEDDQRMFPASERPAVGFDHPSIVGWYPPESSHEREPSPLWGHIDRSAFHIREEDPWFKYEIEQRVQEMQDARLPRNIGRTFGLSSSPSSDADADGDVQIDDHLSRDMGWTSKVPSPTASDEDGDEEDDDDDHTTNEQSGPPGWTYKVPGPFASDEYDEEYSVDIGSHSKAYESPVPISSVTKSSEEIHQDFCHRGHGSKSKQDSDVYQKLVLKDATKHSQSYVLRN
jgi:hypothetical protein